MGTQLKSQAISKQGCCSAGAHCGSLGSGCCVGSTLLQEFGDLWGWSAPQDGWEPTETSSRPRGSGTTVPQGAPRPPGAGGRSQPWSYLQRQLAEGVLKAGKERASHLHQPPRRDPQRLRELKHLRA